MAVLERCREALMLRTEAAAGSAIGATYDYAVLFSCLFSV